MLGENNMLKYSVWKSQHFEWTEELLLDSKVPFGKPLLLEIPGSAELLFCSLQHFKLLLRPFREQSRGAGGTPNGP